MSFWKNLGIITTVLFTSHANLAASSTEDTDSLSALLASGSMSEIELERRFSIVDVSVVESDSAAAPLTSSPISRDVRNGFDSRGTNRAFSADGRALTTLENSASPTSGRILNGIDLEMLGDISTWITLGERLWKLIEGNVPVANIQTQTVSVLPASIDWSAMESWQNPAAKSYTIEARNFYGVTVVSHTYTVTYNYGGSVRGKGQFLANATVIPSEVNVSWGFKLSSELEVGTPVNTGTVENPIPGIDLTLKWKMSSFLKTIEGRDRFFVRGDGNQQHIHVN